MKQGFLPEVPKPYRFYTSDCSIEGRGSVLLTLTGQEKDDWFLQGEVLDAMGNDLRIPLFVSGQGKTFEEAFYDAIDKIKG